MTPEELERYETHFRLLKQWNEQINLVSRKSIDKAFGAHYADSILISEFASKFAQGHVYDVGTGAGFPGILFASRFPQTPVTLFEKSLKKQTFLAAVLTQLALPKLELAGAMVDGRLSGLFLARAVFPRDELFTFMKKHMTEGSILITNLGGKAEATPPPPEFIKLDETQYRLPMDCGDRRVEALRFSRAK